MDLIDTMSSADPDHLDLAAPTEAARIVIVGSGFAGIGMGVRLKQAGIDDFVILERASEVGGTWRDNTYPGCACDVPSKLYSFSFALNPDWTRSFSPQPEIRSYLKRCAVDHDLLPHVRFGCTVRDASWDEARGRWVVETSAGTYEGELLVSGMGALSEPSVPAIPGIESFEGTTFHSATWDHDHVLAGERVAVIGTGASSIQFVPQIQPDVARLDLYQRTPPWVMPRRDRGLSKVERWLFRRVPALQRIAREAIYWARESFVPAFRGKAGLMKMGEAQARRHLAQQVRDPELRARLTPSYDMGCKRVLLSNDYYPALTRPNVDVITDGIAEVRPHSIVATDGTEREVDTIIFGTGFHVTDLPAANHIRGTGGLLLRDAWRAEGMRAYKGTTVAGFPNLFILAGPNTGLGHSSMVFMIESQVAYVLDALRTMDAAGAAIAEVRPEVQAAYNEELQRQLRPTVWMRGGCASWYLDDHGRNPTLWPTFTFTFRRQTTSFDAAAYTLRPAPAPVAPTAVPPDARPDLVPEPVGAAR
ncbi:MAG: FAD-dependent pyridine nucleotide-disulfide oxidoreductase [Frankiales bacterium]|nr:FAD-dependent pyridine nucleotide-disulfide oxidoreductase [Frankiales bacterium]